MGFSCGSACGCCKLLIDNENDFEKICSSKVNGIIPISKYISKSTGFTIVHAEVGGPIVNGYICVATRAEDDAGLPHALEHLISLGSEDYPYTGVLGRLASQCLASGTSAWTDVDYTCFTLSTAGTDGFCQLLPIYMDHIFYPLLADSTFKTEVYHVTENGTDAGVIYSEMQATENSGYAMIINEFHKNLFPTNSGYRWNVEGDLEELRLSCTLAKITAFHKAFYHPRNTCLIVCGSINLNQMFNSLQSSIKKWKVTGICEKHDRRYVRPWFTQEPPMMPDPPNPVEKTIYFPSHDEEGGCQVVTGLLGPSIVNSGLEKVQEVFLIFKYLTESSCSPLQLDFVQNQGECLAASLDFSFIEYTRSVFYFELEGVKGNLKDKIVPKFKKSIAQVAENFDMNRMIDIILTSIQTEITLLENEPHESICQLIIQDFLYSDETPSSFDKWVNRIKMYNEFFQKSSTDWITVINEVILSTNWITIFAEPSKITFEELAAQENIRISKRNERLGIAGLAGCAEELEIAIALNSQPIPAKVLKKVKLPSLKSISQLKLKRIQNPHWILNSDFPANVCLDEIATSFVYVAVIMDTSLLGSEFREYLPLFNEVLLNSSIMLIQNLNNKILIPYEQVISERNQDLQQCEMRIGLELYETDSGKCGVTQGYSGTFATLLTLNLQMERDKIDRGMDWIRKILWTSRWELERIRIAIIKLVARIYHLKRIGSKMQETVLNHLLYQKDSVVVVCDLLHQLNFLKSFNAENEQKLAQFENDIRTAFDCILNIITDPKNVTLHIAANITKVRSILDQLPPSSLSNLLRRSFPFDTASSSSGGTTKLWKEITAIPDFKYMKPQNILKENAAANQLIFGLGSEDSSYLVMVAPGPTSFGDANLPALLTAIQYFTQVEGPFYKTVRGGGHAYKYKLVAKINEGLLHFHLSKCSNLVGAYAAALDVINNHSKSSNVWAEELLVSARSSLIFECLETEKTSLSKACNSCLAYFTNVSGTFIHDFIQKVRSISLKDVKRMSKQYIMPLFQDKRSNFATVIICPPDQVENIKCGLANLGKPLQSMKSFDDLLKK